MKNDISEIRNAIYTGICIYKRLSRTIVKIENEIVSLEDKKDLSLYLGLLHSNNSISDSLKETDIVRNTNINYKGLDSKEYCQLYDKYFSKIINSMNKETIYNYLDALLEKNIVIKLNREYNFNPHEFISRENKILVKK